MGAMLVLVFAVAEQSDNTNVAVPADNGTSSNTSIAGRMQQYVGFYGNVSFEVRNNTNLGNVLYRKTVTSGVLYFLKNGDTFPGTLVNATANTTADSVIGVSGYYNTSNHFDSRGNLCNTLNVSKLTTTDSRTTGLLSDPNNTEYMFCTDIGYFTSSNGFGSELSYEIIVAKTPAYMAYDIWFDLA
ncbi:MAG: hypothetical protein V1787_06440 [Candidatus Micrarchaeota archaeon]